MDEEMKTMVNVIIYEMGRMEERVNKKMDSRFDAVDKYFEYIEFRLDSMQHELEKRTA